MSPKIKSLIYLTCFMASALLYYFTDPENMQNENELAEMVKTETENPTSRDNLFEHTEK